MPPTANKVVSVFLSAFLQGFRTIWLEADCPEGYTDKDHLFQQVVSVLDKVSQGEDFQPLLTELLIRDLETQFPSDSTETQSQDDIQTRASHLLQQMKEHPSKQQVLHLLFPRVFTQGQKFLYDAASEGYEFNEAEQTLLNSFRWFCLEQIKTEGHCKQLALPQRMSNKYFCWEYFHLTSFFNAACVSFPNDLAKPTIAQVQASVVIAGVPKGYLVIEYVKSLQLPKAVECISLYPTVRDLAHKVSHYIEDEFLSVDFECAVVYQNGLRMQVECEPRGRVFSASPSFDHNVGIHFGKPGTYSNPRLLKVLLINSTQVQSVNMPNLLSVVDPSQTLGGFLEEFIKQTRPNSGNMVQELVTAIFDKLVISNEARPTRAVTEKFNLLKRTKKVGLETKFESLPKLLGIVTDLLMQDTVPYVFHLPLSDAVSFEFLSKSTETANKRPLSLKPSLANLVERLVDVYASVQNARAEQNLWSLLPRFLYVQTENLGGCFSQQGELSFKSLDPIIQDASLEDQLVSRYNLKGLVGIRPDQSRYPVFVTGSTVHAFNKTGTQLNSKLGSVVDRSVVAVLWERKEVESV